MTLDEAIDTLQGSDAVMAWPSSMIDAIRTIIAHAKQTPVENAREWWVVEGGGLCLFEKDEELEARKLARHRKQAGIEHLIYPVRQCGPAIDVREEGKGKRVSGWFILGCDGKIMSTEIPDRKTAFDLAKRWDKTDSIHAPHRVVKLVEPPDAKEA